MSDDARGAFSAEFDVSRETLLKLDRYAELLADWQQRMNLVSASTLPIIWDRHFRDSAQLLPIAGTGQSWLDIGAGGGFPGIVLAILDPSARLVLVESIAKKCRFLEQAAHETDTAGNTRIANVRIEALASSKFDIITARAAANLEILFDWGLRFAGTKTRWILPKGARVQEELASAKKRFHFQYELIPSRTDSDARIVVATGVKRR